LVTLGVIADTHIPDRVRELHPNVIPFFREAEVDVILHAGDISVPKVIAELEQVAPVFAVRGNRDFLAFRNLSLTRRLTFSGVKIGLTHGHGSWVRYIWDRIYFLLFGYKHERILPHILATFPDEKVIVFGHGHLTLNQWRNGQLLFNPGSPTCPGKKNLSPSIGLLRICDRGEILGEIIYL
jgi:putative phosphoesterase